MSKNFELLRRAGKEAALLGRPIRDSAPSEEDRERSNVERSADDEAVSIVQRVFIFPNSHAPRVVVFASVEGNGSSEICCRAAEVLGTQGSVCLVDANLRAPSLQRLLGIPSAPGFGEVTARPSPTRDLAVQIPGRNLWIVPLGSYPPEGLSGSNRLRSQLEELRSEFAYVLINAPPIGSSSEAVLVGQQADGVILVVEANSTRRDTALKAKRILEGAHVKLLGAILNNRMFPIPEALYRKL